MAGYGPARPVTDWTRIDKIPHLSGRILRITEGKESQWDAKRPARDDCGVPAARLLDVTVPRVKQGINGIDGTGRRAVLLDSTKTSSISTQTGR